MGHRHEHRFFHDANIRLGSLLVGTEQRGILRTASALVPRRFLKGGERWRLDNALYQTCCFKVISNRAHGHYMYTALPYAASNHA